MQLDRLALHLRRRGPWEALDLGCAMARRWWRPVMRAWLGVYLPVAFVLYGVFYAHPIVATLLLWWLKPLFDRAVLEVLSRAAFGDVPGIRDVWRALARSPGILAGLTIYRFDLARSFNLPVWHLERLRGAAARARGQSLRRRTRSYAVWATIVFFHFELVITLALAGAIDLFTPAGHEAIYGLRNLFWRDAPLWRQWLEGAFYVIGVSALEPFYVAAGFGLYLNRRTQLEAWDVELALRRFAQREPAAARPGAVAAALVLAVSLAFVVPTPAHAAQSDPRQAQTAIRESLSAPEFQRYRDETRLRFIGSESEDDPVKTTQSPSQVLQWIAEIGRVLMWIALAALIMAALYAARRYAGGWTASPPTERAAAPETLFGLDITPESLPHDVAASALAAAEAGRMRDALGLLYRGALSSLVNAGGLEVAPGDTEGDCVRSVARHERAEKAAFFASLVAEWARTAYAGRAPPLERVRVLCREWPVHFSTSERP